MIPKPRPIDHLVLAVRDLEAARADYRRLGFTLTPVARDTFGTASSLALFTGSSLELLAVADPGAIPEPTGTAFSFAAFNRDFLKEREGLSMLALKSADAATDRADFEKRKLAVYDPSTCERTVRAPDGQERKVAFSLTFTSEPRLRDAGFFTCEQHDPEALWQAGYQRHPNGALRVDSVVMVSRDPADLHEFLTHFTGQHDIKATSLGIAFDLGKGKVEVMSPVAFRAFFGEDAGPDPCRFTAFRIAVADPDATRGLLTASGVPFKALFGALVVSSAEAHGAALAFVAG